METVQPESVGFSSQRLRRINFWIDSKEYLIGILMLQFMPSDTYPVVTDFRNLVYQVLVD
jgi:hypothetical protein